VVVVVAACVVWAVEDSLLSHQGKRDSDMVLLLCALGPVFRRADDPTLANTKEFGPKQRYTQAFANAFVRALMRRGGAYTLALRVMRVMQAERGCEATRRARAGPVASMPPLSHAHSLSLSLSISLSLSLSLSLSVRGPQPETILGHIRSGGCSGPRPRGHLDAFPQMVRPRRQGVIPADLQHIGWRCFMVVH